MSAKDKEISLIPKYFSDREGHIWQLYEGSGFTQEQLDLAIRPHAFNDKPPTTDPIILIATVGHKNYYIHALAFDDPARGTGNFGRWDVISGWTTTIEEAEKAIK